MALPISRREEYSEEKAAHGPSCRVLLPAPLLSQDGNPLSSIEASKADVPPPPYQYPKGSNKCDQLFESGETLIWPFPFLGTRPDPFLLFFFLVGKLSNEMLRFHDLRHRRCRSPFYLALRPFFSFCALGLFFVSRSLPQQFCRPVPSCPFQECVTGLCFCDLRRPFRNVSGAYIPNRDRLLLP